MARLAVSLAALATAAAFDLRGGAHGPVLVTGATGRTGELVYKDLKSRGVATRAFVRSAGKARTVLGCSACDESEGVFIGDLNAPQTLLPAVRGISAIVIATSAVPIVVNKSGTMSFEYPPGGSPQEVDWLGGLAQLDAVGNESVALRKRALPPPMVVLISSMGTTDPKGALSGPTFEYINFYKLNLEAEIEASGLPFSIVKPCGLASVDVPAGQQRLLVGHHDTLKCDPPMIARADVARVVAASATSLQGVADGLRYDLCATAEGTPTGLEDADLEAVLKDAQYPWAPGRAVHSPGTPRTWLLVVGASSCAVAGVIGIVILAVGFRRLGRSAGEASEPWTQSLQTIDAIYGDGS